MTIEPRRLAAFLTFAGVAVLVGRGAAERPATAAGLVIAPVAFISLLYPTVVLTGAISVLSFSNALPGVGATEVSVTDVLLVLGLGGLVLSLTYGSSGEGTRLWRALAPAVPVGLVYFSALAVTVAAHPSQAGVVSLVQRLELVVVAALAGAALTERGGIRTALVGYLAVTSVLAAYVAFVVLVLGATPDVFLGVQKNPAGGAMAAALLVSLTLDKLRYRPALIGLFALALLTSLSRGAIIGAVAGVVIIILTQRRGTRARDLLGLAVAVVVMTFAFQQLPQKQQDRLLDLQPASETSSTPSGDEDEAVRLRADFADDALDTFRAYKLFGIGPGNYQGGPREPGITDPHNVYILTGAEGGFILVGGFGLLMLGTAWLLLRRIRSGPLVVLALAVQVSSLTHAYADVYWVRNTPVIGWALVGAALVAHHQARRASAAEVEERETVGAT